MRFDVESYDPVESRLEKFWDEHPNGRLETRLLTAPASLDEVVVWAAVWFDLGETEPRATGLASEKRGGQGANQTSHLENCETSSIGRALANAGYKTKLDAPRPSREEMSKTQTRGERFAAGVRQETPHPESRGDQRARQAVENAEQPLAVKGALPPVEGADLIPSLRRDIGEEYKRSGLPPDKSSFWAWLSCAAETQASEWRGLTPAELERALAVIRQYNAAKAGTDRLLPEPEQQPVASGFGKD